MPIATLSIDIEARLARLEEGMDRAARINQKAAQDIEQRWAAAGSALKAAVAPLLAAFSADVLRRFARAVDSLNDISDATGATVEKIAALQDVAARTGTPIEAVDQALIKLNKTLADAKEGSDAERSLRAIGLSVQQLKALDPAEAVQKVAIGLAQFADDGNKARLVQELFGKSLREVAPLLKDLATAGELNGRITKEQTEQAERFVHVLGQWENNSRRTRQEFVGGLLPTLTEVIKSFGGAEKKTGELSTAVEAALVPIEALAVLGANVAFTFQGVGREFGAWAAQLEALGRLDFAGFRAISQAVTEDGERASATLDALEKRILGARNAMTSIASVDERLKDTRQIALPSVGNRDKPTTAEQAMKNALKRFDDVRDAFTRSELEQMPATNKALADVQLLKLIADNALQAEIALKRFDDVHDAFRRSELEQTDEVNKALKESQRRLEGLSDFAKQARENLQTGVADTLFAGLEGRFEDIDDLWRNLLRRMAAEAAAANLNEWLFGKGPGGGVVGQFLAGIGFKGLFADGGFIPPNSWGIAGERGPEPVFGGSTGVTVFPNGSASRGGVRMGDIHVHVDSRTDRAQVYQIAYNAARASQIEQVKQFKAMGVL